MKTQLVCLSITAIALASCDNSQSKATPDDKSTQKPRMETRTETPAMAEKPAPAASDASATNTRNTIPPPLSHTFGAESIRPAGPARDDGPWESLTPEQKIEKFRSSGIARMPKDISDKILANASKVGAPRDQVNRITQEAVAWHRINSFRENSSDRMPDHMKSALLEKLGEKHGHSWLEMVPELEEQVAANIRVDNLRTNGIPGLSRDESEDIIIQAIEKFGPDYKAILSFAEQSAKE